MATGGLFGMSEIHFHLHFLPFQIKTQISFLFKVDMDMSLYPCLDMGL
jgi:hypothetical protein